MYVWIKEKFSIVVTALITIACLFYLYGCESKTTSLVDYRRTVNRQELQLEFDQFINMGQIRMTDLDQQDAFKAIILKNALILVQGQPLNPLGMITGVAAIYGITQGGCGITKVVKSKRDKRKNNNG